jgi:hypothetical protein
MWSTYTHEINRSRIIKDTLRSTGPVGKVHRVMYMVLLGAREKVYEQTDE